MKQIVIYCSASAAAPEKYNIKAEQLVKGLCEKGYGIVSGGTLKGTMGAVSRAAVSCGGHHKGVLPRFMKDYAFDGLSETVFTDTMALRKEEMRRDTIAAIALPGGTGTLDELIETQVLRKLGQYSGRVIILNLDGFYEPFLALMDHYVATGMQTAQDRNLIEHYTSVESLIASF